MKKATPLGGLNSYWLPASERSTDFCDPALFTDVSSMHRGEFFVSPIEPAGIESTASHKEPNIPIAYPLKRAFILKDFMKQGISNRPLVSVGGRLTSGNGKIFPGFRTETTGGLASLRAIIEAADEMLAVRRETEQPDGGVLVLAVTGLDG